MKRLLLALIPLTFIAAACSTGSTSIDQPDTYGTVGDPNRPTMLHDPERLPASVIADYKRESSALLKTMSCENVRTGMLQASTWVDENGGPDSLTPLAMDHFEWYVGQWVDVIQTRCPELAEWAGIG